MSVVTTDNASKVIEALNLGTVASLKESHDEIEDWLGSGGARAVNGSTARADGVSPSEIEAWCSNGIAKAFPTKLEGVRRQAAAALKQAVLFRRTSDMVFEIEFPNASTKVIEAIFFYAYTKDNRETFSLVMAHHQETHELFGGYTFNQGNTAKRRESFHKWLAYKMFKNLTTMQQSCLPDI